MADNPIVSAIQGILPSSKPPVVVEERVKRGSEALEEGRAVVEECFSFWRGDQYVYRSKRGYLINQATLVDPEGGKPRHRVRTTRNLLVDIVAHEVSASTQRVPAYEVNASTSEAEDISAGRLSSKIARFGYDKWKIRHVTEKVVTHAIVGDEGFAWPFWDSSVGPYIESLGEDGEISTVGQGEVKIRIFGRNQVGWEPGVDFEDSSWHFVRYAQTPEKVKAMDGFMGGSLKPDATVDDKGDHAKLVMVTEYLERPSIEFPQGRWITLAGKKQIVPERSFPCQDGQGNAVDEPVLHKLAYITDPDKDRDMGLVRHLLDSQRTYNDCVNKMLEWKNLALNPQVIIRNGEFKQQLTDEPGAVYHAVGSGEITWRPVPPIPGELSRIKEEAKEDMARIAAQNDIPSQVESGRGIAALLEKDMTRRAAFIGNLAEFHSRLMRHCLYLVQRHYTEARLIKVQGDDPEIIADFQGAQLRGQADVTVLPGSIEPRTRAAIDQRILAFADRGWIPPDAAMAAINGGTAENLVKSYERDIGRARRIIQKIRDNALFGQPERPALPQEQFLDETGTLVTTVAGWMPRPFDNIKVHKTVFEDWMKADEYDLLEDDLKQAAHAYYDALLRLEAEQANREAMMQQEMAQSLGMSNASKPQKAPPSPDQAGLNSELAPSL